MDKPYPIPKHFHLERLALILILALAAYLRLVNLVDNPGWYTDEGTHLDIAQHYRQGRVQYLAINQSTLLFAKLPLFELLLAGSLAVTNDQSGGIGALRVLTGSLGLISTALLYLVVCRIQGGERVLALLAAAMYTIYPMAVLYNRFGFSYNLLTPFVLLTYLGLWEYLTLTAAGNLQRKRRLWLSLASLSIGLGAVSDLWMLVLIGPLIVVVLIRPHRWQDIGWALLLSLLPFGLYSLLMLIVTPQAFLFDAWYIFHQVSHLTWLEQLQILFRNCTVLLSQDYWVILALPGLFLLRPVRLQWLSLLLFLFPIVVLGRTVALYSLSFYYMIPLLPFVALGVAVVIKQGAPFLFQIIYHSLLLLFNRWHRLQTQLAWLKWQHYLVTLMTALILVLLLVPPFIRSIISTASQVQHGFKTAIDPFLLNPADVRHVAVFINQQMAPADVVIASPGLAWLLLANVADFQMSTAATGQETVHLPADVPSQRFVFDPHYEQARFVIVDNLWRNWAVWHIAGVPDMMAHLEESWPIVFKSGQIVVYGNPNR